MDCKFIRIIFYLFLTISFLLLFSCVNDFKPKNQGTAEGNVVVNGILFQDSIPKIFINRSRQFDAPNSQSWIEDAEVRIHSKPIGSGDDMLKSQFLVFKDSFYVGNTKLDAGMEYFLDIETGEGSKITAKTMIPHPQKIQSTRLIFPAGTTQTPTYSGPFSRINLNFNMTDKNGFFETFIYNKNTFHPDDPERPFQILQTFNRDEIILKEALPDIYLYAFVFSANNSASDNINLQFDFIGLTANPFFTEFYMVLQTCSEEYYLYKKSLYTHLDAQHFPEGFSTDDLYFPNIFRQINPVYSNIKGGRGIFAGLGIDIAETVCNLIGNTCG